MDDLLLEYKMPETSFLIESLHDNTGRISSGTRDMLITALSVMSRRSNSIRVIAYDYDSSNAIAFLERASGRAIYHQVPKYDIRGSISQYDSRVASDRASAAVSAKDWGVGGDRRVSGDVLGIDLSVVRTADLSVIPSATSSNQVIIIDSDGSTDGDAIIKKSAIYFNFSLDRSEGRAQAVRNLLDLAAIELIGRLMKVPYWQCLGISEESESVKQEVSEWMQIYDRDNRLIQYVRRVLYIKGFYNVHAEDPTLALQQAVVAYQQNIGVQQDGVVDHDFMLALLKRHQPGETSGSENDYQAGPSQPPTPSVSEQKTWKYSAIDITLESVWRPNSELGNNETQLEASLSEDGYLYCYFQGGDGQIQRLFPNRFQSDNYLPRGQVVSLPGSMPFAIEIEPDKNEAITCFATDEPVADRLPLSIRGADFEVLATNSMAVIKEGFIKTALAPIGEAIYDARPSHH